MWVSRVARCLCTHMCFTCTRIRHCLDVGHRRRCHCSLSLYVCVLVFICFSISISFVLFHILQITISIMGMRTRTSERTSERSCLHTLQYERRRAQSKVCRCLCYIGFQTGLALSRFRANDFSNCKAFKPSRLNKL